MAGTEAFGAEKAKLRDDTARFLTREATWRKSVVDLIEGIETLQWPSVLFGGAVRDIFFNRLHTRQTHADAVKLLAKYISQHTGDSFAKKFCSRSSARESKSNDEIAALLLEIGHFPFGHCPDYLVKDATYRNVTPNQIDLLLTWCTQSTKGIGHRTSSSSHAFHRWLEANTNLANQHEPLDELLSCLYHAFTPRRPRDIDLVVQEVDIEDIEESLGFLRANLRRKTRFGGLQIERGEWHFDVWPLNRTYYFYSKGVENPTFDELPKTTFLNIEAIAVEAWTVKGRERKIFSGEDQFFHGMVNQVVELNCEETPFPELNIVRSLNLALNLGYSIGPRLSRFVASNARALTSEVIQDIQMKHYGQIERNSALLLALIGYVADQANDKNRSTSLWPFLNDVYSWRCVQESSLK